VALTKAREIALFTCLETVYSPVSQQMAQDGMMSVQKIVPTAIACFYTITTFLTDNVYPDADLTAVLEALLDKWIALGTRVDSMTDGNISSLQNISYSVEKERAEIKSQVQIIVPYRRLQDQMTRAESGSVAILR